MMAQRSILITGATSGIGRALALNYAAPGIRLLLVGRNEPRLTSVSEICVKAGAVVEAVRIDVQDKATLKAWIEEADQARPIDLAIASAGITSGIGKDRVLESANAIEAVLSINLAGVINAFDPLIKPMMARGRGHLAAIGSLAALRGLPYSPAYSASKAAVHAYIEGLRPTLKRSGIMVSLIAPGFVETPLNRDIQAPRPMQMSAERAASIIRRGLDNRKPMIAFPWPLYFGIRFLNMLPARFGDWLLAKQPVHVPETIEKALAKFPPDTRP